MVAAMYDIKHIKNYILFLKKHCGLSVTLHPLGRESLILTSELITFNIHDNPYCVYVKSFPEAQKHCIKRQKKIIKKCEDGAFCGSCFAGVREFVYPIRNSQEVVGFISVSGYRSEHAESYIRSVAETYFIPIESLTAAYKTLKEQMPSKEEIDTLLIPLCNMLELAYVRSENDNKKEECLIDAVIRYIKQYHTQNIKIEDVCRQFACSRSHISHMFKQHTGKTFREYLTEIRLEDAKALLRYSELGVTEIAFSVGMGNSSYFSSVFKRYVGVSPAAYRKAQRV